MRAAIAMLVLVGLVGCDAPPPATVDPEVRSGPVSRAAHNHDPESAAREA